MQVVAAAQAHLMALAGQAERHQQLARVAEVGQGLLVVRQQLELLELVVVAERRVMVALQ